MCIRDRYQWYSALASLGLDVRVVRPESKWAEEIQILVAPAVQMVDVPLIERLERFVRDGGDLVLTPRTGLVDRTGQFFECPYAARLHKLMGTSVRGYDVLPEASLGTVEMSGKSYRWNVWADLLDDSQKVTVLGRYTDQFYAGTSAIVQHKLGNGRATYCGVIGESSLYHDVLHRIAADRKLSVTALPPRVQISRRDGLAICVNYRDEEIETPAPKGTEFLIGTARLKPAQVAVWTDTPGI
jgi:beta-galactosidase